MKRAITFTAVWFLLGVVKLSGATGDSEAEAVKKDLKAVTGTWMVVAAEIGGEPHDQLKGKTIVIVGAIMMHSEGKNKKEAAILLRPLKGPKEIDFIPRGDDQKNKVVVRGIYRIDGDTLTLCFGESVAKREKGADMESIESKRPLAFDSTNGMLIKLKREKP